MTSLKILELLRRPVAGRATADPARASSKPSQVTPVHHVLLFLILAGASLLGGHFYIRKSLNPAIHDANDVLAGLKYDLAGLKRDNGPGSRGDSSAIQAELARKEALLADVQSRSGGDKSFVDVTNGEQVESLFRAISRAAGKRELLLLSSGPAPVPIPAASKRVTRLLEMEGTYQQLYAFLGNLQALPYRIFLLEMNVSELEREPGMLHIKLVIGA